MCASRPLRRPSADLHGACEAVRPRCGAAGRMDHGSQYPDHLIKFWGIQRPTPSSRDQRRRRSIARSRRSSMAASPCSSAGSNSTIWIVEKNGYLSPAQARNTAMSLRPAHEHPAGGRGGQDIWLSLRAFNAQFAPAGAVLVAQMVLIRLGGWRNRLRPAITVSPSSETRSIDAFFRRADKRYRACARDH